MVAEKAGIFLWVKLVFGKGVGIDYTQGVPFSRLMLDAGRVANKTVRTSLAVLREYARCAAQVY